MERGDARGPSTAGGSRRGLQAELIHANDRQWESTLEACDHDFYHLPEYVTLCAEQVGGTAAALLVRGGPGALLLPVILRDIPFGGRDAISPYGYPGPLVEGGGGAAFTAAALRVGIDALREAGLVSLFVRYHPLLNDEPPSDVGTVVRHGDAVCIDLSLPEDVHWRQTRENHRRDIRRAIDRGQSARIDTEWANFAAFERLYADTMERRHATAFYRFDERYFDGLRQALGERIHLAVAERDGVVVSAALFVETAGIVQYHLSGSDGSDGSVLLTKVLIDYARRWAKARGDRWLCLGGGVGGRDDSLLRFKRGFSPLARSFWTQRVVMDEQAYGDLVARRDPSLDPDVRDGFFPLYRIETPAPHTERERVEPAASRGLQP